VEYENTSEQRFSFGSLRIKVGVDGNVDSPEALCDHMLATAATIGNVESLRSLNGRNKNGSSLEQTCTTTCTFGEISMSVEIGFKLAHQVSLRTLNTIVFGEILPRIWEAAGIYLGNQKAPRRQSHSAVLSSIDNALSLNKMAAPGGQLVGAGNSGSRTSRRTAAKR
jgi:hypothetical protein